MAIHFHLLLDRIPRGEILHLEILNGRSFSFTPASSYLTMKVAWAGVTALRRIKRGDRML